MSEVLKDPRSVKNVARHKPEHLCLDQEEELESVTTAIFYSITSTQAGLQGIELGTHLIKQAVALLRREIPSLERFSTLSPIPGFRTWLLLDLMRHLKDGTPTPLNDTELQIVAALNTDKNKTPEEYLYSVLKSGHWITEQGLVDTLKPILSRLCARYLYEEKRRGKALDPVANFHIRNGAMLYRINWMADPSPRGMGNSFGLMVNYRYILEALEENSREYINNNVLPVHKQVLDLL
jgi:malonyl-CoA decarboxylase